MNNSFTITTIEEEKEDGTIKEVNYYQLKSPFEMASEDFISMIKDPNSVLVI